MQYLYFICERRDTGNEPLINSKELGRFRYTNIRKSLEPIQWIRTIAICSFSLTFLVSANEVDFSRI